MDANAGNPIKDFVDAQVELQSVKEEFKKMLKKRELNMGEELEKSRKEHEANKKSLKSDLKKSTAFVKRIKAITSDGIAQCIRETDTLNLNLYIS